MSELEISMIVHDVKEALKFYRYIFDARFVEVTNLPKGENRAIFLIYGVTINLVDENRELSLFGPEPPHPRTVWYNLNVPDIKMTYAKALASSCVEINPVGKSYSKGLKFCMFIDPFGYLWQLQQRYVCRVFPIFNQA
jgi:PhnB protein